MEFNVGELRKLIKDLSDDTPIISKDDNYELRGAITKMSAYRIKKGKFRKELQWFQDDFDRTNYQCEVFVPDEENGEEMLYI